MIRDRDQINIKQNIKLLGLIDLAARWNYTKQGVHQKMRNDQNFPKPVAIINKKTLVFLEADIILYECKRRETTDPKYKYWYTHIKWTFKDKVS